MAENHQNSRPEGDDISLSGSKSDRTRDWVLIQPQGSYQDTATTESTNERSLPFSTGNTGMKKQLNQNAEHLHEQSLPCDKTDLTKQTKEHPYPRDNRHSQMHTRRLNMKSTRQTADVSRDHGFFKRGLEAIVTLAIETLGNHDSKIRIADKDLESTKLMISDNDDKNNPLLHEANAKDDKLSELEKHRKQYITYLKCRRDKLFHMYEEQDFGLLNDVRKNFGIECRRLQSALPIYARRDEIVHLVKNNQVCVIIGETGSGKSTQLVQYLYHAGIAGDHFIACTQPRKIAAISLATYVSSELASRVGRIVGYHVGMKTRLSAVTRLVYMTDHTLLNECLHDENLESYSCVIIDEAHERSIYTDLLLGMLKEAMLRRPELKVIVTSATINPATFVAYFGGAEKCPVMYVSGRTYPVNVVYDESESNSFPDDYELKAVNKAIEIHQTVPIDDGDMLVFLTSPLEVDKSCDRFRRRGRTDDHICLPLYGSLQVDEQQLVFQPPTKGKRKVVFATNCAETSITIPGIKYVIDTGVVKEMRFDSKKNMNTLSVVAVSQSSADQRKGRAGRTGPGICNRLFSENDFQTMDKMGKPEILRVHLGQGLLTLLELGVNPTSFDFVESPSVESIENAMHSLRNIGAVSGTEITDLGKWVAKLQVEPRLGIIIKHGLDEGIPIEGIVIAACCTTSGIFFRAGSDEEKKKADLQKLKFCHEGGDLLSMLNAYREWKTVEERKKGQWCRTNSINGKAMKLVNDMVIDILALLRKTMKLDISNELSTGENVDEIVQKLIFQCMRWNICCYLGHEKAGYLTCDTHQRVRIHPSSSVLSLGVSHKWVVFSQIIQTSDSFITNVTPVPDTEIEQALADNVICFDNDIIESKKVSLAVKVPLGSVAQRNLVGAMHRNRRQLEATISAALSDTLIILDWEKENSEMDLYCLPEYKEKAREMFLKELATVTEPLLKESREEGIGHHASGTRVVIEAGIAIRDILTPDQYRCVHVKLKQQMQRNLTENDLKRMMPSYEHIECVHTLRGNGILVTFCHATDAAQATEKVNADGNSEIILVPERHVEKKTNTIDQDKKVVQNAQKSKEAEFTLRANWCRRPSRGFCYVHFENQEDEIKLLPASDMLSQQHNIRIKKNAKAELMIHDLKYDADENELVQQLASAINMTLNGRNDKRIRVVIPRQNVPQNVNETSNIRGRFTEHICQTTGLDRESFQIDIKDYKAQTARNIAFIRFRNPEDCQKAASCLDSGFQLDANMPHTSVTVSMELRSSVHIHKAIFAVTKEELEGHITEEKESNSTTTFVSKVLKSGHTVVDINSESLTELAKASRAIHRFIEAETLDGKFVEPMFTKSGRYQALQIEKKYECVIFMNQRTQTLKVHGPVSKRQLAVKMILSFLNQAETAGKNEKQICLKGKENPVGLMKCIISKYGIDLEGLRQECDLLAVSLNVRSHVLSMSGTDENISRAMIIIEKIKGVLSKTVTYPNEQADCPICLCPVDPGDVSHLEYCGHPYCTDCLSTLVQNAIQDKAFPIECAADDCGKPLVIKDINAQIKRGNITWNALTTASLECFVTRNNSKFRYCITPDCPMVYPVTTNGMEFKCSQCQTHICTTCHIQYHYSLTCAMYNSIKHEKDSTEAWVKLDPSNRKRCPKCKVGIEKNGGCNHMTCPCGAHICWKCLRFFASPNDCYSHLGQCY